MLDSDQERGKFLLIVASIIFSYFTVWILGLPFMDDRLRLLFCSHKIALIIPAFCGLCFIGSLVIFTVYHLQPYLDKQARER